MSIKTILACLSSQAHARDVLAAAVPLARHHGAYLIGLRTPQQLAVYPSFSVYVPDAVEVGFLQAEEELTEQLEEQFSQAAKTENLVSEYRVVHPPMPVPDRVAWVAHTTDLVVMAQDVRTDDRPDFEDIEEAVIRRSGRPVLMVPKGYSGSPAIGNSVVIGWSATPQAARAVHDTIPLLSPNAKIAVVLVGDADDSRRQSANDAAAMLARYGFEVEVAHRQTHGLSVAGVLKREAMERGTDLMVTGAFGHSRLYDFVIGAVTVELMRTAEIPVLFSR